MSIKPLPSQPGLVLFDLDDTLCDYAGARTVRLRTAFLGAFASAGHPAPDDDTLDRMIEESIAEHPHGIEHFPGLLARFGVSHQGGIEMAQGWYRRNRFHGLRLFADALHTVEQVRAAHATRRIGLITNGPADVQRAKIALLEVEPLFDFILVSEEVGSWKPEPEIFHRALELGQADPAGAIFVGDSVEHDMVGALGVGIGTVWVNRHGAPWPVPQQLPDWTVCDLASVRVLLGAG